MSKQIRIFFLILFLTLVSFYIALPNSFIVNFQFKNSFLPGGQVKVNRQFSKNLKSLNFFGKKINLSPVLKQGLDIQGGMQVLLKANVADIPAADRDQAIESARDIIARRVDLYGISEPVVQTSQLGDEYRIIVELAGMDDPNMALQLVGQTAQLEFKLQNEELARSPEATQSAVFFLNTFESTGLTGKNLKRSTVVFDQNTGEPMISLEFDNEGTEIFADITKENVGKPLAIFIDGFPITSPPIINDVILTGKAQLSGGFSLEEAKNLNIQLNAGALPVPIEILEQRQIGATLGQESVSKSVQAGLFGILLVMLFMILYYGMKGFIASVGLLIYAILTIALYKIMGVVLTLPGIAGLLLSVGMAVDANILIFERMKEELRLGKSFEESLELGFGRSFDSIKDANLATIMTALILINPLDLNFLPTSGLVKGFGITLLIGVLMGLFTGVIVTRNLLRLFLRK